mgnify:CR=1 FL=1
MVSRDVEPYTVVGGVPAVLIKPRFRRDTARALAALAWWDWPHDLLKERLESFCGTAEAIVALWSAP